MSGPCSDSFRALAESLGGISCETADPFVTFRAPDALRHWSMPVVELLMIGGALLALVHAIRLRGRTGNAANLGLWVAAVTFVFALEPPLYFPHQLGYGDRLDVIFVHNVFSVQFLYDRLPLYIVALYPSGIYLAYALVARLGLFERKGRLVGAIGVGFLHQCFYEIFDHLGPALRWWAWNPGVPLNEPRLGSVPLVSMAIFGVAAPALLAYTWRALVAEPAERGTLTGRGVAWRAVVTGLVSPFLLTLVGAPVSALLLADPPHREVAAVVLYGAILAAGVITTAGLAGGGSRPALEHGDRFLDRYAVLHGATYLGVFAVLWLASTPAMIEATNGVTADGAPIGNPTYVVACAAVCAFAVGRAARDRGAEASDGLPSD